MRKIIVSNLVSLDGFFEGSNRELDWFIAADEDFFDYARDLLRSVDTILFGRMTYQLMAAYWPTATDNDPVITHKMNNLSKIVFSKTLSATDPIAIRWNNSRLIKEDISEEVSQLKQQPGKDMVIFGSDGLVSTFSQLNLIDEYRLIVNPVAPGHGNSLFKKINNELNLELQKTKTLGSGIVILYYDVAKNN